MWRTKKINILLFLKTENGFDRLAFSGIAAATREQRDTVIHVCSEAPVQDDVERHDADGIIISSDDPEFIDEVLATKKPAVNITNHLAGQASVPVVGNDDAAIGRLVATHYLERGFRNFAYFASPTGAYFNPRRDAYVETLKQAGFTCKLGPVFAPHHDTPAHPTHWADASGEWLASLPKPVAVMCPWDIHAREATIASEAANLRVPEDVSIIGVDNDELLCMAGWPHISSVQTAAKRIGYEAAMLLRSMIADGKPAPAKPILLPPVEIVVRGSSSETAVEDQDIAMAVNFIHANIAQRLTIADIVKHTAISRRALERRFVKALERTPMEEIRRVRVEKAKRLLLETELSLTEVARASGLVRLQRLCTVFKAETGKTPLQFRKDARPGE
ncbi:MAG: substrate-binding domain-containing protein [Tepidisphaeraceae bacterium]